MIYWYVTPSSLVNTRRYHNKLHSIRCQKAVTLTLPALKATDPTYLDMKDFLTDNLKHMSAILVLCTLLLTVVKLLKQEIQVSS
jgi:hypothetical protein